MAHQHHGHHGPLIPAAAIPDLRFEKSYTRTIEKYVHVKPGTGKDEEVEIAWKQVLWITIKDQCISPLIQGAVW